MDAETEVQRSRFVCWLRRAESEAAARAVIDEARSSHWQAHHHCSAFVVGPERDVQRSNDDGEPAGTAGRPMLDVLSHDGISDVVAVVTRYFGGVKLGTGGLARAYSGAVAAALESAPRVHRLLVRRCELTVSHADVGRVEHALRGDGFAVNGVSYGTSAVIALSVRDGATRALQDRLASLGIEPERLVSGEREWLDAL